MRPAASTVEHSPPFAWTAPPRPRNPPPVLPALAAPPHTPTPVAASPVPVPASPAPLREAVTLADMPEAVTLAENFAAELLRRAPALAPMPGEVPELATPIGFARPAVPAQIRRPDVDRRARRSRPVHARGAGERAQRAFIDSCEAKGGRRHGGVLPRDHPARRGALPRARPPAAASPRRHRRGAGSRAHRGASHPGNRAGDPRSKRSPA